MSEIFVSYLPSTLGRVLVASTERGVRLVVIDDSDEALRAQLAERCAGARAIEPGKMQRAWAARVVEAIDAQGDGAAIPMDVDGTPFQHEVWAALRAIPRGGTSSYAQIARAIGKPGAIRAVGAACGANPIAVIVPCHRVLRSDGKLGGYRWGLQRKQALLVREGATLV
jgi:AraC family transcriptional regulator of adaptative response/methylated-DNA-[protein]-cysteine methyltransferase